MNLIEHNQRPITVNVLLRLGDAFGVNIQEFAVDDTDTQSSRLQEVLADPLCSTGSDLTRQDLRDAVERVPLVVEALQSGIQPLCSRGVRAERGGQLLAKRLLGRPAEVDELLDALEARQNHFAVLETRSGSAVRRRRIAPERAGGWV